MISIASHNAHLQNRPKDTEGCCPTCAQHLPETPEIVVDKGGGTILRNGTLVYLTVSEMDLFWSIYRHAPHVVSFERILVQISDLNCELDERHVSQNIYRVNRKIKPIAIELKNIWDRGYRAVVGSL